MICCPLHPQWHISVNPNANKKIPFAKMPLEITFTKLPPFCSGLSVLVSMLHSLAFRFGKTHPWVGILLTMKAWTLSKHMLRMFGHHELVFGIGTAHCRFLPSIIPRSVLNTLRSRQNNCRGHSNIFSWIKMCDFRLKVHHIVFPSAQLTIFQYWFR